MTRAQLALASLLALGLLVLASAPALANTAHSFSADFGTSGEGAGELSLTASKANYPGAGGSSVAVNDETHDLYVADTGNDRIDEFEADGTFVRAWGWGVADGLSKEPQVCELTCSKGLSGAAPGELESPNLITVDNDPASPSHGDVYVTTGPGEGFSESSGNLVTKFTSTGELVEDWGVKGQINRVEGQPTSQFGGLGGITVDASGNLWMYVGGTLQAPGMRIYVFGQNGDFVKTVALEGSEFSPQGIGVDDAGALYVTQAIYPNSVVKLSSTGGFLRTITERQLESDPFITGLAVDPAGPDIYVDWDDSIEHFAPSCQRATSKLCVPAETVGSSEASGGELAGGAGLAVDSTSATVYAVDTGADRIDVFDVSLEATTTSASNVLAKTATLTGTVNPKGSSVTECRFEYGKNEEYGHSAPCESPAAGEVGSGKAPVPVHADLEGLQGGTTYHFRLVVTNATNGELAGDDEQMVTPPTPLIANAVAIDVTASSASLTATIDPLGVPVTSCAFEYGTSLSYGMSAPCAQSEAQIGAGTEPVPVSTAISSLAPNTEYHWRLVAENANGSSIGTPGSSDHTFVYDTTGAALPDNRAYEMVTPPAKNGASIGHVLIGPNYDISESGSTLIAPSIQCFAEAQSCTGDRQQEGEPYEFTRTSAGWLATALAPPATEFMANSAWEVGAAEGAALFSILTEPGGEDDFYVRRATGVFLDIGPATPPESTGVGLFASEIKHGTADLSHLVYGTEGAAWPFDKTKGESLYEYVGIGNAEPFLVAVSGGPNSTELIDVCADALGARETPRAVSADGRTVYFLAEQCAAGGTGASTGVPVPVNELYARIDGESPDAHTVAISEPKAPETLASTPADENCTSAACQKNLTETANWRGAKFEAASGDGSKVFFLSGQQLTDDAAQGQSNLYEYDFSETAGHNLIDISAGDISGVVPHVEGTVAASADGSHVYFVAEGVLTNAPNGQGQSAAPRLNNLYVYERDSRYPAGHVAFIADLPASDSGHLLWGTTNTWADVTPDGRFLVFESNGDLTPDDTRSDGARQIFRYDAETQELVRISIGDEGFDDDGNAETGNATIVPGIYGELHLGSPRLDPTMSNDGSYVLFQSPVGLTPHALNDVAIGYAHERTQYAENVYEYHNGRVYLISDGHDTATAGTPCGGGATENESAVCLLGTDANGSNVFFTTTDHLVREDTDTQLDIYDARICEPDEGNPCIAPPSTPLPPCLGEACHGVPAATPSLLTPGTASFDGEGNIAPTAPVPVAKPKSKPLTRAKKLAVALKACEKEKGKVKRRRCEASARRRFGAKATRANTERRAKR